MMTELEKAISYIENNEVEKGLDLLQQIKRGASPEEKFFIAEKLYSWGLVNDALEIIDELLQFFPLEGELLLLKAEILIDRDDEEQAIELLNDIESDDPIYVQSLLLLADLYQMQGLNEVSEAKLLEAKKLLPGEPVIDFGLAEFYLSIGQYNKAVSYYDSLLNQEQDAFNGVDLHQRLAECLCAMGQFEESMPHFDKALKNKLEINTLFEYAFAALQAEYYQTAIEKFNELKEIDPEYHSLYLHLAKAYEHEEMLNEAYNVIVEGISQDEFNKELFMYKGKIALKLGKEEEAEEAFKQAIALDPGYIEAILTLSKLLFSQERYEDVIDNIQTAMGYNEYDPHFEWDLAKAYQETEQYEDALNHYETAYNLFKDQHAFLEDYGYFLLEEGQREKAKEVFKKLLEMDPASVEIQDILFQLEE
jgi:tetratricopeptide (TPR) repeat protein